MENLISILAVGLLIALHEAGHFTAAVRVGMKVRRYSIGLLRAVFSWTSKKSGIVYQIGILPLGGFVEIKGMNPFEEDAFTAGDSYQTQAAWRRATVLIAGPLANLLVAWVLFFLLAASGLPMPLDQAGVGEVAPSKPAYQAGLQSGDRITHFNGEPITTWNDLTSRLEAHPDIEVTLQVDRNGESLELKVTPASQNGVGKIGIGKPTQMVRAPIHHAAIIAVLKIHQITVDTWSAIAKKLVGHEDAKNLQTVGPLGIVQMAATALGTGFRHFAGLMAYISVMLFLFNLLPIPALDGGRGLFLLIEVISRKKIKPKVEAIVNSVGFFLLIGLLLLITGGEVLDMVKAK